MKLFHRSTRISMLELMIVVAIAILILPGCSQLQNKLNSDVDKALAPLATDLDKANARALAAHDPNPAHALCFSGLADGIRAKDAADKAAGAATDQAAPDGLADAAEAFLLSDNALPTITTVPLAPGVKSACYATIGELRVKAKADALKWAAALTAGMHKVGL